MSGEDQDTLTPEQLQELLGRKDLPAEHRLDALDMLAGHHYDEQEYREAAGYYEQGAKEAPEGNTQAYFIGQAGICHYLVHQDEKAIRSLLASKEIFDRGDPPEANVDVYALVLFFLGSYYEYMGQNEDSLKTRLKALRLIDALDPEPQWMLLSGLSRNYQEKGEHEKAIDYTQQAISLISDNDPELAYLYESMGANYYELGEFDEALSYYSRVLKADPEFENIEEVHRHIASCYQRLLDYRTALDSYLKLLDIKKLEGDGGTAAPWLYTEIAHCLYHLKEHKRALEVVRRGLDQPIADNTELANLRSFLTSCNRHLGRHEEAVKEGEKTLKIASDFTHLDEMLPNLALSYYELNRLDEFKRYRELCQKKFPDSGWSKHLKKLKA